MGQHPENDRPDRMAACPVRGAGENRNGRASLDARRARPWHRKRPRVSGYATDDATAQPRRLR